MSDFLSKFNNDKYSELVTEQAEEKSKKGTHGVGASASEKKVDVSANTDKLDSTKKEQKNAMSTVNKPDNKDSTVKNTIPVTPVKPEPTKSRSSYRQDADEEIEIDLDYKRKKRLKLILIISGSILACILLYFIYYSVVHVKVEDLEDKPVSEARAWAKENDVEIELEQEYSKEYDVNQVMSQSIPAGKKIRKGKTLKLVGSLGPDPQELIELPDFSKMTQTEASEWVVENKADSIQFVTDYHDKLEKGEFIKFIIRDPSLEPEDYKRQDGATLYYSKGQETFEKNITVPNFIGGMMEEVEKWAEANEIELTTKEGDSDTIETGLVASQSVAADEKVAKRDKFEVVVSIGKSVIVPSFSGLTGEDAAINYPDLNVTVKQVFHPKVAYGKLISQSIEAGTKLTEKDDHHITVTYSEGKPYLRDYRGQLEGDLPSLFYTDYQSKGADIKYYVKFVDSPEVKGTVVKMSKFNEFVSMTYTVEISISNNASPPVEVYEEIPEAPTEVEDVGEAEEEPEAVEK